MALFREAREVLGSREGEVDLVLFRGDTEALQDLISAAADAQGKDVGQGSRTAKGEVQMATITVFLAADAAKAVLDTTAPEEGGGEQQQKQTQQQGAAGEAKGGQQKGGGGIGAVFGGVLGGLQAAAAAGGRVGGVSGGGGSETGAPARKVSAVGPRPSAAVVAAAAAGEPVVLQAPAGSNLRDVLSANGINVSYAGSKVPS